MHVYVGAFETAGGISQFCFNFIMDDVLEGALGDHHVMSVELASCEKLRDLE